MPLKIQHQSLPEPEQALLSRLWLRDEFKTLKRVIVAKAIEAEAEAMGDLKEAGDFTKYSEAALKSLKLAQKYRDCLAVLAELESVPSHKTIKMITAE